MGHVSWIFCSLKPQLDIVLILYCEGNKSKCLFFTSRAYIHQSSTCAEVFEEPCGKPRGYFTPFTPRKADMTGWKISVFNTKCIFKWLVSVVMFVFRGGITGDPITQLEAHPSFVSNFLVLKNWFPWSLTCKVGEIFQFYKGGSSVGLLELRICINQSYWNEDLFNTFCCKFLILRLYDLQSI